MNRNTLSFDTLAAIIACAILQACACTAVRQAAPAPATQCAKPTLYPPSASGPAGASITVTITTATNGAYLRWTDDGTPPTGGSSGHGHVIKASSGPAPTVYGRTLRAIGFKSGFSDSPVAVGSYNSTRQP